MKIKWFWFLLLIPCLPLLAAGNRFVVPAGTNISDVMVTHYPNLLFIQRSLMEGSGIPLWSPQIFGGYPFAANPLSTLWYPPAWLALIFPLPLGINLVMVIHILTGCTGMAYLLRKFEVKEPLIWLGAVLYGLLPAGFARSVGGHFTWVSASAWLPWLLSFTYSDRKPGVGKVILPAAAIGLMMLSDLRFAAYSVLIWIIQNLFHNIFEIESDISTKLKNLGKTGLSLILAFGISAIVWLPLMEYSALSTRNLLTLRDTFYLSLPILLIIGFIVPGYPSTIEWITYLGAGLIIPGLYSFGLLRKHKNLFFWWGVAAFCLLWSVGEVMPINHWLASFPGFNLLRVPARGLFFLSVSLLIISMISLNELLEGKMENIKLFRLGILGILVLTVMLQIGTYLANPDSNIILIWHALFTMIISGLFLAFTYRGLTGSVFSIIFSLAVILDLGLANWGLVGYRSLADALTDGAEETMYIASRGSSFRVFSPSYSIPQHTAANAKIELVAGVDPLQLSSYVGFVTKAANLPVGGYSVTLPAFVTGNPKIDNIGIQPDVAALGLLNTRYFVSAFPIGAAGWILEKKTQKNYIYSSNSTRGWAWIEKGEPNISANYSSVKSTTRTNNDIVVEAEGPGKLVLSEVNYPGWQATIEGQPVEIGTAHSILRSVSIPEGSHIIYFKFVPYIVFEGGGISLISILICIVLIKVAGNK